MGDFVKVDWQALEAARRKYRQLNVEIEKRRDHADLQHTSYKLGMFLDEALHGAFKLSEQKAPDAPPEA